MIMFDIRLIRADAQKVKDAMKTRNKDMDAVIDEALNLAESELTYEE